ncbi:MAG TPA: glycosyl hydrolase family 28-related protein, partial [Kribbella sp.]
MDNLSRKNFLRLGAGAVLTPSVAGSATGQAAAVGAAAAHDPGPGWGHVGEILRNTRPPQFRLRDFSITGFGAVGDGTTLATAAIAKAIDACHRAGGGRVVVPAGTFLTGAIHLQSNVELHVSEGATLRFSTDPADYLPVVLTRFEGAECMN